MPIPKFLTRDEETLSPASALAIDEIGRAAEDNVRTRRMSHPDDYGLRRTQDPAALAAAGLLVHYETTATRVEETAQALRNATEALVTDTMARLAELKADTDKICAGLAQVILKTQNAAEDFRSRFDAAHAEQREHMASAQALIDRIAGVAPALPAPEVDNG